MLVSRAFSSEQRETNQRNERNIVSSGIACNKYMACFSTFGLVINQLATFEQVLLLCITRKFGIEKGSTRNPKTELY